MITDDDKLAEIERLIQQIKTMPFSEDRDRRTKVFAAVAADIRGRRRGAPSVALHELLRRLTSARRSKTRLGYESGAMIGLGEELIGRWPVVEMALDLFGAMIESGDDPFEAAFQLGFEHAVAGGKEAGGIIPKGRLPLVMYFGSEEDRREMIDAVQLAKPGMARFKIPERAR